MVGLGVVSWQARLAAIVDLCNCQKFRLRTRIRRLTTSTTSYTPAPIIHTTTGNLATTNVLPPPHHHCSSTTLWQQSLRVPKHSIHYATTTIRSPPKIPRTIPPPTSAHLSSTYDEVSSTPCPSARLATPSQQLWEPLSPAGTRPELWLHQ